jgi:hypothetical protein
MALSPRRSLNADRARSSRRVSETAISTRELVEAKTRGLATTPRAIAEPLNVINLTEALKRSLAQDAEAEQKKAAAGKPTRTKAVPDRRQRDLLLPVSGGREKTSAIVAESAAATAPKRRKKAG